MNKLSKKTTRHDLFQTIWQDSHYLCTNPANNSLCWIVSQDIQDEQPLIYLELVEEFVDVVSKSTGLPFVFEKTLEGTILKKTNRLGALFYNLLRRPHCINRVFNKFNGYKVSENFIVKESIASDLKLACVSFTGNPRSEIAPGVFEGELINSFAIRLREATQRKCFRKKVAERKKESTQSFTKSKRYIDRLKENTPSIYGVHMVVCYQTEYASSITLEQSHTHLIKFLELFEKDSVQGLPVGWWWKREYLTEVSYRYHLILFFDGQKTTYDPKGLEYFLGREWAAVTKERGLLIIPPFPESGRQHLGTGFLQQRNGDSLEYFLSSIQHMLMRDTFLKLEPSAIFHHFGMGKLPKLLDGTPKIPSHAPSDIQRHFRSNLNGDSKSLNMR
jgi:hypothetical protein